MPSMLEAKAEHTNMENDKEEIPEKRHFISSVLSCKLWNFSKV